MTKFILRDQKVPFSLAKHQYKDIPENQREQFYNYAKNIWDFPLIHKSRGTDLIQGKWKEWLRKSFLASKSGVYNKHVFKYGEHWRQKIAVYTPKVKSEIPLRVVYYAHGGYLVNGAEEAFQYLAKQYIPSGYILVVSGFRQLPDAKYPDSFDDIHYGYLKSLEVLPNLGGRTDEMTILTWSGAGLFVFRNLNVYQDKYKGHVSTFISLASPWEAAENQLKIASVFLNDPKEATLVYPQFFEKVNIEQEFKLLIANKQAEFPHIYQQNVRYLHEFQKKGIKRVTLDIIENHDHYDVVNNEHLGLSLIRRAELDRVKFNNELSNLVFFDKPEKKAQLFEVAKDPVFVPIFDALLVDQREKTKQQFDLLMKNIKVKDYTENPNDLFTKYDVFSPIASGAVTKIMTHFSTAVGTIIQNGTERHQKYLEMADAGKMVCAFGMTELMGGNNIGECGTTATYDHKTKEFIFHNSTAYSMKFWAASLGYHANYTVLFAKTIVNKKNEGINAFIVPIRDQKGNSFTGVILGDFGHKLGLNGIDNGYMMFQNYRVSADCLLNKYNNIDENGVFHSKDTINARFFKTIERLLLGRIIVTAKAFSVMKAGIYISLTFSRRRLGVAYNGLSQQPILTYQLQQNAIVPIVAKGFVYNFLLNYSKELYCQQPNHSELTNVCNVVKILVTDFGTKALTQLRERIGGQGLISSNRIPDLLTTINGGITGEGDNKVVLNKVAKDMIRLVTTGKIEAPQTEELKINSLNQLDDLTILLNLFKFRETKTFQILLAKFQSLRADRKTFFEITMFHAFEESNDLVYAYGERHAFEQSLRAMSTLKLQQNIFALTSMFRVAGSLYLQQNLGFFLANGVISSELSKQLRQKLNDQIKIGSRHIEYLVENWNVPKHALYSPITGDYVKYYAGHHKGEVINAKF